MSSSTKATTKEASSAKEKSSNATTTEPSQKDAPAKSGGFLGWFETLIGITDDATAITIMALICFGIVVIIILLIVAICLCKKMRKRGKEPTANKRAMQGVTRGEWPNNKGGQEGAIGSFEFALEYEMKKNEMKVTIIQANDLILPNSSSTCDPYCKFYLNELKSEKEIEANLDADNKLLSKIFKTSYKDDTCNPTWSESFTISLPLSSLDKAVLTFEVFDYDTVGHDVKLGILEVPLNSLELSSYLNRRMEMTGRLVKSSTEYTGLGDVCVILRQSPDDEQLHVTILEAKRLSFDPEKFPNPPDVQVSVTLLVNKKRLNNKKTSWRKNTRNPYFSETLIFPIKTAKLSLASVTCSLKYKNAAGLRRNLGRINLGIQSETAGGQKHWQEMLDQPRRAIAMWHEMTKIDPANAADED